MKTQNNNDNGHTESHQPVARRKCLYKVTKNLFGGNGETILEWTGECGQEGFSGEHGMEWIYCPKCGKRIETGID